MPRFIVFTLLSVLVMAGGCSSKFKQERHLSRAEKYYAEQELEKAKIEYLIVHELDRTNAVAFSRLGRIYLSQGSVLQALGWLIPARRLAPNDPDIQSALGELLLGEGRLGLARAELQKVLDKNHTNVVAILLLPSCVNALSEVGPLESLLDQLTAKAGDSAALQLARANLLLKQGKSLQAEQCVQNALRLNPEMPEAHAEMTRFYLLKTNFAAAEAEFKQAIKLAPARSPIGLNYATFKALQGDRKAAKDILKGITARAPDYLLAQEALVRYALEERNYVEALSLTERIISQDSLKLETFKLRSQIHAAMGNPQKAIREWSQLETRLKDFPGTRQTAKMELARAYVNSGDTENALPLLDAVATLSSNRVDQPYLEASLLKASIQLGQNRGAQVVNAMGLLLQRTNIFQAHLLLADGYRQIGRSGDALNIMQRLVTANPNDPQLAFTLGMLLREQNKPGQAREVFMRCRELRPLDLPALNQLVELEVAEGNFPIALKLVQEEQRKTNSAPLKFLEGFVYVARKQVNEAESAFMKALELDPYFTNPYFALASLYIENKRLDGAIRELELLIQKQTNNIRALMLCAMLYSDTGKLEKARELYERLILVSPGFASAYNNLAYILSQKSQDLDAAYRLAKKAYTLDPKDPGIADTLGWILYQKEDYTQALPLLKQASLDRPQAAEILYHFGMAAYMMGYTDQAKAALEKAINSKKQFTGKEEAQRRLALLSGAALSQMEIVELEASIKSRPRDVSTRLCLASAYEKAAQPRMAAEKYEEILRSNPQLFDAALRLTRLYSYPLQDPDRALQFAQKAYELDSNHPEACWLLGRVVYQKADYARAHALLNAAARQLGSRPEVLYDYGWAAYGVGRLGDAAQAMRQALARGDSAHADAIRQFLDLNALYFQPESLAAAELRIRAALKLDPNYVPALMAQASLERQRGGAKQAAQTYRKILQSCPTFAPANRELALTLVNEPGAQEEALKCAAMARETFPDDSELARVLGILSFQKGNYLYARTLLEQVAMAKPNDAELFFRLGLTHLKLKAKREAKQSLERALALNLQGANQQLAIEELARLK